MTTTFSPAQVGEIIINTITYTGPYAADNGTVGLTSAVLYRFQLSPNLYFCTSLTLDTNITSLTISPSTFKILITADPDAIATIGNGEVLAAGVIPSAYSTIAGVASSYELASKTITSSGSVSFDLDLAVLTRFMSSSLSYDNIWNGSLLLWLVASQGSTTDSWSNVPVLTAAEVIDYPNRDTGTSGNATSRWDRCPVSGRKIPHDEMVMDGFRHILVHPDSYDPEEPEPMDWPGDDNSEREN